MMQSQMQRSQHTGSVDAQVLAIPLHYIDETCKQACMYDCLVMTKMYISISAYSMG